MGAQLYQTPRRRMGRGCVFMNQSELYFLTITLSLGLGSGAALSKTYGYLGFFSGLVGSIVILFLILCIWRRFAPRRNQSIKRRRKPGERDQ